MKKEKIGIIVIRNMQTDQQDDTPAQKGLKLVEEGARALIATDFSTDDASHEAAMDAIRALCSLVDVPVIGTGDLRRLEDIKKLLYAGCSRVAFRETDFSDKEKLTEETISRFGAERLAVLVSAEGSADTDLAEIVVPYDVADAADLLLNGRGTVSDALFSMQAADGIVPAPFKAAIAWEDLKKGADGLIPTVVQDVETDEVLMVAWMNEEAYLKTIETGRMTYYSRSRESLWIKGETSGHYQYVRSLAADCDKDTLLARVRQIGAACHTGSHSCFFNEIAARASINKTPRNVLEDVYQVIADRKIHPKEGSYTNYLFDKGIDKILKKCGEECTEIVIAAKNPGGTETVYEISDLLYHLMVLMVEKGITWEEVTDELARR